MARNPTVRAASRAAQNERRKLERRIARVASDKVGRSLKWGDVKDMYNKSRVLQTDATISALMDARASLVSAPNRERGGRRVGYSVDVGEVAEDIRAFTQTYFGRETLAKRGNVSQVRRNRLFERQMNLSTRKQGLSALSGFETKMFYAVTRDIWRGADPKHLNDELLKRTGIDDLETFYGYIVRGVDLDQIDSQTANAIREADERFNLSAMREAALRNIRATQSVSVDQSEEYDDYSAFDVGDDFGSPPEINAAISELAVIMNVAQ